MLFAMRSLLSTAATLMSHSVTVAVEPIEMVSLDACYHLESPYTGALVKGFFTWRERLIRPCELSCLI